MKNLVENILSGNMLVASEVFEAHINDIMERKLYEKKRMMQAEVFGGLSKSQIEARKKAGWMRASEFYGAMNKLKDLEGKYKSDINKPKEKKKKKIEEEWGDLSQKELKKRGQARARELGAQIGATAKAAQERGEREKEKRAAKKKSAERSSKAAVPPSKVPEKPSETGSKTTIKFKTLRPKKAAKPEGERYSNALKRAKDLEARGATGKVSKIRQAYRGYRAKSIAKDMVGHAGSAAGRVMGTLASYSSLSEENN